MSEFRLTGGCQCGAVRYVLHAIPTEPRICHCRMCQKHTGSFFGAFADVDAKDFELTRGELALFRSSGDGYRSFCRDCGTPLGYRYISGARFAITIGSLDEPAAIKPTAQYGIESRMPWFSELFQLPAFESGKYENASAELYEMIRTSNRQHPDHDTAAWPPPE
jgi:hypothetical protein